MNTNLVKEVANTQLKSDFPFFKAGDTVKVMVRITENGKSRLQAFEGVVLARRGSGVAETFIVRKISNGVGVERVFPVNSVNSNSIKMEIC